MQLNRVTEGFIHISYNRTCHPTTVEKVCESSESLSHGQAHLSDFEPPKNSYMSPSEKNFYRHSSNLVVKDKPSPKGQRESPKQQGYQKTRLRKGLIDEAGLDFGSHDRSRRPEKYMQEESSRTLTGNPARLSSKAKVSSDPEGHEGPERPKKIYIDQSPKVGEVTETSKGYQQKPFGYGPEIPGPPHQGKQGKQSASSKLKSTYESKISTPLQSHLAETTAADRGSSQQNRTKASTIDDVKQHPEIGHDH